MAKDADKMSVRKHNQRDVLLSLRQRRRDRESD